MNNGFEEAVYDAACMAMGEAVWQLVAAGEPVTQDSITYKIVMLSACHDDLAASIARSVLLQA